VQVLESATEPGSADKSPKILDDRTNNPPILTTAAEVQSLTREQASRGYHTKIRGVVTWVSEHRDCVVIQDSTRGVFVGLRRNWIWDSPAVGEILEIEGTCVAGEFSPIVILKKGEKAGRGFLPVPVHPTYEQLISGSMDSQYIEIRGYITEANENHMTLLMPGGKVNVEFDPRPPNSLDSLVNSVVRIRGCMFAKWDHSTMEVTPDRPLWFGSATICVDVPPPDDPFDAVKMRAKSLMQFNAQDSFFRRVKISGQVLCENAGIYYITESGFGLRFQPEKSLSFNPGDHVDVVGLVQLGGASPVLTEAIAHKTGHSPLPPPQPLTFNSTNVIRDATRVQTEGSLVDSKNNGTEQVMEIQNGLKNFIARFPVNGGGGASWPLGSRLKLTGIFSDFSGRPSSTGETKSFELLLNSSADVELLALPPWWTLSRLLTMITMLAVGLVFAFVWINLLRRQVERRTRQLKQEIGERKRVEQERAIERERSRIAQDLHDDLGSNLTAINMLAMTGSRTRLNSEVNNERFQMIVDRSRAMVTDMDALVWAVNPQNDTLFALAEYLASFAEELLAKTGITYHVELPADFPKLTLAGEIRHNVLLSVKEALTNALRHGKPGEILLRVTISKNEIEILIQDNGCGFDLNHNVAGNGLANLHERMCKVNGHCRIQSSPGNGTMVCLILPPQAFLQC